MRSPLGEHAVPARADGPRDSPPAAAAIVCAGLEDLGEGIDLGLVSAHLRTGAPELRMRAVADLCTRPDRLRDALAQAPASRVVLGLCHSDVDRDTYRAWAVRGASASISVEFPPLGLAARAVSGDERAQETAALLAASAARAAAAGGGGRTETRLPMRGQLSRRSLFGFLRAPPRTVASIDPDRCVGSERCGSCVSTCPRGAISAAATAARIDPRSCDSCGACLTHCPTGAIAIGDDLLLGYAAQLEALLSARQAPAAGILFVCGHAVGELDSGVVGLFDGGWLPMEVPSLALVTPGWVFQALAKGAAAVALLACGDPSCRTAWSGADGDRLTYCQSLVKAVGLPEAQRRVVMVGASAAGLALGPLPPASRGGAMRHPARQQARLGGPGALAAALRELTPSDWAAPGRVESPSSPFGLVSADPASCTACGACALSCPTGALTLSDDPQGSVLSCDPARCTACGWCVPACPEHALAVERATDPDALAGGPRELARVATGQCAGCGRPLPATSSSRRVHDTLAASFPALAAALDTYCSQCLLTGRAPRQRVS